MIGLANGAVDDFIETGKDRLSRSGAPIADFQSLQMRAGEAAAEVDAAKTLMRSHLVKAMAQLEQMPASTSAGATAPAAAGPSMTPDRAYAVLANSHAAQLALRAIDRLYYAAGASKSPATATCNAASTTPSPPAGSSA